jgi:DNA-directed RNA polymerase sigma subunit (sigma70/sigma32)
MTLAEIGRVMGISKERVRQLETRAKDKMARAAIRENIEPSNIIHG